MNEDKNAIVKKDTKKVQFKKEPDDKEEKLNSPKKISSSFKKEEIKENKENIENNESNKKEENSLVKDKKDTKNTILKQKSNKKMKKDEKKSTSASVAKPGIMQISKEEFFNQIKGVKLKKMTPNTYFDPDEIKKKDISKSSSPDNSIEVANVSVKDVRQMIEEKLRVTNFNFLETFDIPFFIKASIYSLFL